MSQSTHHKQRGFTIIELMIATTVFSVVLLICSFAMLQIGRTYYKGITMARTQTASRSIMDEISQVIQFSGSTTIYPDKVNKALCIDSTFYKYELVGGVNRLNRYKLDTACSSPAPALPPGTPVTNILGSNMRLGAFDIEDVIGTSGLYSVKIRVVYGDGEVLNSPDLATAQCRESRAGGQFCAISELSTVVQKRL